MVGRIIRQLQDRLYRPGTRYRRPTTEQQRLINGMTNWQRSQWQRWGRATDLEIVQLFADMPRRRFDTTDHSVTTGRMTYLDGNQMRRT